ncbi:RNA-binding cell elongation regulator Jag/EloR [uncultured Ilyobacter sp.]|jgi:spoIIIJ-associated protein|uniref:RNA-binding cell elongation regulator Jag/EloR n=1 Tax=uncultured Ilyobacter sp. TaxID=544433 RepID=UPI0029C0F15F|nr:RNA-binding cell elongation regulator Jag/EloR [uncultured Ilyobacter sp.]
MSSVVEIKAMTKEEAIQRALKICEAKIEQVIKVEEKIKSKSFLGFFKKEGLFEIEIKKEKEAESEVIKKAQEILDYMGLNLQMEILKSSEHFVLLNLYGEDNGIIIGKKGKTLNSFEYLLNSLVKNMKVEVDVEGFKEKRANTLRDLARKMSEKALKSDKAIRLNPMPPRERKIIHEIVNKYEDLDTYSEGRDPKRYIVIKKKRQG